jgi:asparagine synthase (glutamine-hydrolysing)
MFAFAIWDSSDRSLVLARDHYGQKPLFFAEAGGAFLFASEIKALLASGRVQAEPDVDTLYQFLGLRYCPGDRTLFRGVRKLPPATWMIVRDGTIRSEVYWDPSPRSPMVASESEDVAGGRRYPPAPAHLGVPGAPGRRAAGPAV